MDIWGLHSEFSPFSGKYASHKLGKKSRKSSNFSMLELFVLWSILVNFNFEPRSLTLTTRITYSNYY